MTCQTLKVAVTLYIVIEHFLKFSFESNGEPSWTHTTGPAGMALLTYLVHVYSFNGLSKPVTSTSSSNFLEIQSHDPHTQTY
jgi:hypothetical protein